jgi:hypothetical protein
VDTADHPEGDVVYDYLGCLLELRPGALSMSPQNTMDAPEQLPLREVVLICDFWIPM